MQVTVDWASKQKLETYTVAGKNLQQALNNLNARDEWGETIWNANIKWITANGNVMRVRITPSTVIRMPTWSAYRNQPQSCKVAWDKMWRDLKEKHEDKHHNIFERYITKIVQLLEEATETSEAAVKSLIKREEEKMSQQQKDFDRSTEHGRRDITLEVPKNCN